MQDKERERRHDLHKHFSTGLTFTQYGGDSAGKPVPHPKILLQLLQVTENIGSMQMCSTHTTGEDAVSLDNTSADRTTKEAAHKPTQTLVMEEQTLVDNTAPKEMQQQTPENEKHCGKNMTATKQRHLSIHDQKTNQFEQKCP